VDGPVVAAEGGDDVTDSPAVRTGAVMPLLSLRSDMHVFRAAWKLLRTGFALIGVLAVAFVVLSYGWNGEPPDLSLE